MRHGIMLRQIERNPIMPIVRRKTVFASAAIIIAVVLAMLPARPFESAQQNLTTLTVRVDQPGVKIDPLFYGVMTEEINHAYDGGLYAELIRNRTFRDNPQNPVNWSVAKYN